LPDTPKFTQIGIFGLKKYHLATLVRGEFGFVDKIATYLTKDNGTLAACAKTLARIRNIG
jgi:hypothetical protein